MYIIAKKDKRCIMTKNRSVFPSRIVIELTPLCDLSCSMCPRHIVDKHSGYMKFELWKKLIDEIKEKNPDAIVLPFWRGESLLHKEFIKFSEYAIQQNIRLHISTNGHFVVDKKAEVLSLYEFITFSLHTTKGFENALKFVSEYKTQNNIIQASFVDCEEEMKEHFQRLTDSEDLFGFDAIRLYEEHSKEGKFGFTGKEIFQPRYFCPKLNDSLVIAFDGKISRCNHIWNCEAYNLQETSIQKAWDSVVLKEIQVNYPDNLCMPCDQWAGNTNGKVWKKENGKIIKSLKGNS